MQDLSPKCLTAACVEQAGGLLDPKDTPGSPLFLRLLQIGRRCLSLAGNLVLALNQAARIVPRRHMAQPDVARQAAEERNSFPDEHWHTSDNEALNQPCAQKPLNRDSAIDV